MSDDLRMSNARAAEHFDPILAELIGFSGQVNYRDLPAWLGKAKELVATLERIDLYCKAIPNGGGDSIARVLRSGQGDRSEALAILKLVERY